jgi:RNA 2',3'-cyclic 3'-phosphodiesterase
LIDPDRAHVTTHHLSDFVGQMPPNLVPAAKMAAATVKMQPFDVTFDRAVGTGQQFLLRASDGSEALCSFQRSLTAALIAAGLRRYLRGNIRPHMTLSYGVNTVRERPVDPVRWTVQEFVLVESLVGAHRHIVLGRWPLQP